MTTLRLPLFCALCGFAALSIGAHAESATDAQSAAAPSVPAAEPVTDSAHGKRARQVVMSEKPIHMRLPKGREVIIKFPDTINHIKLMDDSIANAFSQFLTPDGVLYITANQPFSKTRFVCELVDGRLILLDMEGTELGPFDGDLTILDSRRQQRNQPVQPVQAVSPPTYQPQAIAAPPPAVAANQQENPYKPDFLKDGVAKTKSDTREGASAPGFHHMVQFGFRHFVGPERLIGAKLGDPVKVSNKNVAGTLVRMNDGKLSVKPLKQWRIGKQYLTVLLVNNLSFQRYEFDPRAIRGRWMFAAALYPVIEPQGSRMDQTLWALVSELPFDQARQ